MEEGGGFLEPRPAARWSRGRNPPGRRKCVFHCLFVCLFVSWHLLEHGVEGEVVTYSILKPGLSRESSKELYIEWRWRSGPELFR